jgi:4'-phosphopantetheinyl transferase
MPHRATVWLLDSRSIGDDALASLTAWLNPAEMQRYQRFVRRERQRQFVIGRVMLRQALGQLLGMPAGAISLIEQPGNAPRLELAGSAGVGFSISHSAAWIGCAVSDGNALGLDIEVIDPSRDLAELAAQAFDADENALLAAWPEADRARNFYQRWSAKEARFKLNSASAHCTQLFHPELSVALCSAQPLAATAMKQALLLP